MHEQINLVGLCTIQQDTQTFCVVTAESGSLKVSRLLFARIGGESNFLIESTIIHDIQRKETWSENENRKRMVTYQRIKYMNESYAKSIVMRKT